MCVCPDRSRAPARLPIYPSHPCTTTTQGADPLGAGGRWVKSTKDKYAEQPLAVTQTTIPGFEVSVVT
jgi:hypothetical protein